MSCPSTVWGVSVTLLKGVGIVSFDCVMSDTVRQTGQPRDMAVLIVGFLILQLNACDELFDFRGTKEMETI